MRVSRVVGVALLTLRVTETVKEALPVIPPPVAKSTFTIALAAALSATLGERDARVILLEAGAAAGLASVFHDAQEAARRFTDNQIVNVMARTPRRAQPLGG